SYSVVIQTSDGSSTYSKTFTITVNNANDTPTDISFGEESFSNNGLILHLDSGNSSSYPGSGNTWYDLSENNYNAVLMNSPSYSSSSGGLIGLNGSSQWIQLNSFVGALTNNSAYTISIWFKSTETNASGSMYHNAIFSMHTANGENRYRIGAAPDANRGLYYNFNTGSIEGRVSQINLHDNQWHNITITKNTGVEAQFYIDDVLRASNGSITNGVDFNSVGRVSIGQEYDGGNFTDHFQGNIPIVMIYNRALDQIDRTSLYDHYKDRYINGNLDSSTTTNTTSIDEEVSTGTVAASLYATDSDTSSFTFSLVNGNGTNDADNSLFTISGNQLVVNGVIDYETNPVINVYVQVSDGNSRFSKGLSLDVNDVNEAPTDIGLSANAVDENLTSGTVVGGLSTTDVDSGDTHTYTLVSGAGDTDNASFSISGANLLTNTALDYETKSSYNIRVQTSDGTDSYQKAFTITVNDLTESSITQVASNNPNGTYRIGETIDIQVTFDNAVTVSGSPRLLLETGDSDSNANYFSGSGSTVLTFRYTVNEDDLSGDLDYASTAALELNGGTIVSSSNTAAALSLPSIGSNKRIKKIVITENSGGHQTLKAIHMIVAPDGGSVIDVATTSLAGASTTDTHHQNQSRFGDDRLVINLLQNKTNNKSYTFNSPATAEITFNQSYSINDLHEFTFYGWARYGGGYYGRIANFNFSFKDDDGTEVYSFTSPSTYINGSSQLVVHRLIGEKGTSDGSIWQDDINGHFSSAGYGSGWYVNDHTLPSHGGGSSLASVKNIVIDGILAPTITQTQIALDNSSVSLSFSEAVFNTNSGSGSLQANDFTLSLSGGNATLSSTTPSSISVDGTTVTLGLALSGTPNGKELLTVTPAVNSIYDSSGTAAEPTQNNNTSHLIPNIVTTNLVLFLDAANNSSYSGSGNNWYDLSGNNNHGVIDGASYSAVGGGSISFDGTNDRVIIQDNNTLDFSSEITISYVLEPNWGDWSPFISKGGGTNNRNFSTWVGSDKGIDIDNRSSGSVIKPTYTASSEMANGRLSVVTVAIENSTGILRTYVNGILRNSQSGTLGSPNSGLLYIGNHGDENFGSGKINKLLLYNQALTNDQVYQNYLAITNTPQITVTSITSDNSSASLTFDQVTFNTDAGSGSLQASDFTLSLSGGNATLSSATPSSIRISGNTIELGLSLSGVVDGNEVLTISPVAHAVFNTYGFAATSAQSNNTVNLIFTNSVPTDITLSSSSINENVVTGTTIGALSSTDADAGDIHTYSLISGTGDTDNGSFTVSGTNLLTATALDFEVKSSYAIRLESSDGSATYSKALTITVNDVNEAPT
ncbi:LamG domain-containing protein, partial [Flavobacteriaceae bacterium]|nr:LamG domain-containing protein [Flavobacteriaceae bacterium]